MAGSQVSAEKQIRDLEHEAMRDIDGLLDTERLQALAYLYAALHKDTVGAQRSRLRAVRP